MTTLLVSIATLVPLAWFLPGWQTSLEQHTYRKHFND